MRLMVVLVEEDVCEGFLSKRWWRWVTLGNFKLSIEHLGDRITTMWLERNGL